MKKGGVAFIGMILALVFILIGLFGSWYYISITGFSWDISLTSEANNYLYMAIIALIFCIIALIGTMGLVFNFGELSTMRKIGGGLGILTFIFALLTPIYFLVDFASQPFSSMVGFWNDFGGPGYAWYLMIIAAIIALISSIAAFKIKTGTPAPVQPPAQ